MGWSEKFTYGTLEGTCSASASQTGGRAVKGGEKRGRAELEGGNR